MENTFFVAVDGPAGAGKSTVSQETARRLGLCYLDTGAMYRAVTWRALQDGVTIQDEESLRQLVDVTKITLKGKQRNEIFVNGSNITGEIRSQEINKNVSFVARSPVVRRALVRLQREIAFAARKIIMEGRDIGTSVLPDAHLKLFLTASLEVRARRRQKDLAQQGVKISIDELKSEIARRDQIDSERQESPLLRAEDAVLIETTGYSFEEVVDSIVVLIEQKMRKTGC